MNFRNYLNLTRPINSLIVFFTTLFASFAFSNSELGLNILIAPISAMFSAMSGMVINDIFDFEIDKINKPNREISSGRIGIGNAIIFYLLLVACALYFNSKLTFETKLIGYIATIIIFIYSWKLKKVFLIGNIIVSLMTGLTIIYGASSSKFSNELILPFCFAFLITLSREILKTIEDLEGDKLYKVNSIANKIGVSNSIIFAKIILFILFTLDIYPFLIGFYSFKYFIIVSIFINFGIIYILYSDLNNKVKLKFAINFLKYSLFGGLLALWLR